MKLLHCADLHLASADEDYCLAVLDEILERAARLGAEILLFAGDAFDSWADAESLRAEFRERLERLPPKTLVVLLPGNHEYLRAPPGASLGRLDFGRAIVPSALPFEAIALGEGADLIALPPRRDYSDYRDWRLPEKRSLRVVAAHASVAGLNYLGPREDSEAGAIDPDLFEFLRADYAALGHIHAATSRRSGSALLAYPGSARVWRAGEEGPRKVLFVDAASAPVSARSVELAAAGSFRRVRVAINPDGSLPDLEGSFSGLGTADAVRVEISGAVEDERAAVAAEDAVRKSLAGRARSVSVDRDDLLVLAGISTNRLAARFLEAWRAEKPEGEESEREAWARARILGLRKIKEVLESRK
jgi:DNA repair protein SbcD/Mre11